MPFPNVALDQLLRAVPDAQALEDALFRRAQIDIEEAANRQLQSTRENVAGRGLGIGQYLADLESGVAGEQAKALEKARLDAFTAAQQARLAALGSAASQTNQSNALTQAADQASKNRRAAKDNQFLSAGAGIGAAGLGTLGRVFAPEIKGGLRDLVGLGGSRGSGGGPAAPGRAFGDTLGDSLGAGGQIIQPAEPFSFQGPDLSSAFEFPEESFDVGLPSFNLPDLSFDLGALFQNDDDDFLRGLEGLL